MPERDHLSIGEVLNLLRDEYPDITVSKIRFLESRGLIEPERTASGYRKFYEEDVERLRWILTQQKEHFLPLRVIRDRLDSDDPDDSDEDDDEDEGPGTTPLVRVETPTPAVAARPTVFAHRERTLALSIAEVAERTGLTVTELRGLERLGLLASTAFGDETVYDDEALAIAHLAARFKTYGVEGRHLRMYKVAAEREAGVYEQLLAPLLKRPADGRAEAIERAEELAALGEDMRAAMLRATMRGPLTQ